MKICKLLVFLFICLFSFQVHCAQLLIKLDRDVVVEGDVVYLTVSYSGEDKGNPDLSSLNNDFKIVSNMSSYSYSYVNGNYAHNRTWKIGLVPLKSGKIKIKPVSMGNIVSNYEEINVKPMSDVAYIPDSQKNSNSPYFKIEQKLHNEHPYIKQQVNLTVIIYDSLGINDGVLGFSEENLKNWNIVSLSQTPKSYKKIVEGKRVYVREYPFALFPAKSGRIAVPQAKFDGYYIKNLRVSDDIFSQFGSLHGFSFNDAFGEKEPVRMKARPQEIEVMPAPDNISLSAWLPLTKMDLKYNKKATDTYKVGDAISKKIIIDAYGIQESSFPTLSFPDVDGFKVYPEKPIISQKIVNDELVTTAELNTVYIPEKSGTFIFPELEIEWFNVLSGEMKKTIIPADKVSVYGGKSTEVKNIPTAEESDHTPAQNTSSTVQQEESRHIPENLVKKHISLPIIFVFIVFLIVILAIFMHNSKKNYHRNQVVLNIKKHNYHDAKKYLLEWAKFKYNDENIKNFNDIAEHVQDNEFAEQLKKLNKLIYSTTEDVFDSNEFVRIFVKIDKNKIKSNKKESILPNLYD